ncbi:CxC2 domain-containing protein [Mycena chlorophos]|uniref:CxC2 domain-containing protein n=1 Tax=Mycena chlorophos TaxID=658473 RepID=A0A8H6TPW0_MYCCL|nr:CxC2 domain-containing protein [Mycena chlorophos]
MLAAHGRRLLATASSFSTIMAAMKSLWTIADATAPSPSISNCSSRLFPATVQRPQTCATFCCLDRFNVFSLKPKVTAFDFYDSLERLTNGFGEKPPDRYRMLLRMEREWRHLLLLKRGGRFGYQSNGAEDVAPGELAIRCPACPRPGVNIPDDWQEAEPRLRCIYSQFFAIDACFQLKRRMVSSEMRDPALGPGFAFMVDSKPYREYLRSAKNKQEMSTCSYAATGGGDGGVRTARVRASYQRWGFAEGRAIPNMDYLFASMLRHVNRVLRKVVSYDIVCQWNKKIFQRLKDLPPFLKVVLLRQFTRFVYDLNLIPGSGQTDAEAIERAWAAAGGLSGSTRMMGPGARSDMLDAYWSFWNWTKVLGLPVMLRQRLDAAKMELEKQKEAFELFSEEQATLVPHWTEMVTTFEKDGSQKNPYVAEFDGESGAVEQQQRRIKAQAALKKSQSTANQINLGSTLSLAESTLAEDVPLFLPSALVAAWREASSGALDGIVEVLLKLERELRCAQMGSALEQLRNHLRIKYRLLLNKELHVRHQAANTRARTVLARNESQISLFADMYQIAWFADIRYMTDPEVMSKKAEVARLREAKQEKRTATGGGGKDPDEEDAFFMQGTNKNVMSWIWRGTKAQGSEAAMLEALRIEWCKAWARVRRWNEESWAAVWEDRAKSVPVGSVPEQEAEGMVSYGLKKAAMHRKLAASARQAAMEPKLAKGRKRVRWVEAPVVLIGEGDGLQTEEEELEAAEEQEQEELDERGDLDSDDEWW